MGRTHTPHTHTSGYALVFLLPFLPHFPSMHPPWLLPTFLQSHSIPMSFSWPFSQPLTSLPKASRGNWLWITCIYGACNSDCARPTAPGGAGRGGFTPDTAVLQGRIRTHKKHQSAPTSPGHVNWRGERDVEKNKAGEITRPIVPCRNHWYTA